MDLNDILAATLRRGCGVELDDLIQSEEFQNRLAAREAEYERLYLEDSDLGTAFRSGHLEMGELLQNLPEEVALQQAEAGTPVDAYTAVLLECVGEELLQAALRCLPCSLAEFALLFSTHDADQQVQIIGAIYTWLQKSYETSSKKEKAAKAALLEEDTPLFAVTSSDGREKFQITVRGARDIIAYYKRRDQLKEAEYVSEVVVSAVASQVEDGPVPDFKPEHIRLITDYFEDNVEVLARIEWMQFATEKEYVSERVLPQDYGRLGDSAYVPSCLGMSLMLAAFARRTGLAVMLVNPVDIIRDYENTVAGRHSESILEHLDVIGAAKTGYRKALKRNIEKSRGRSGRVQDFHYSVAIRVSDGRWVQLDPYQHIWGVYGPEWELDRIYDQLTKYRSALPGLTLIGDDAGSAWRWHQYWIELMDKVATLAQHLLQTLETVPAYMRTDLEDEGPEDYLQLYGQEEPSLSWVSGLLDISEEAISLVIAQRQAVGLPLEESFEIFEFLGLDLFMRMLKLAESAYEIEKEEDLTEEQLEIFDDLLDTCHELFETDEVYRKNVLHNLTFEFTNSASDAWRDVLNKRGHPMLDPVMQFSLPEYNLGLAVASHVRCWTYPEVPGRLLVGLSSSQILWHEAVDLSHGVALSDMNHPDVVRAEAMVRALPHHHAACDRKLDYIAQQRAEEEMEDGTG